MLAMSVDHQLFYKAYSDFEDVDGDGIVDTTYTNNIEYAGYFDSSLCYTYSSAAQVFSPSSIISHTTAGGAITSRGYCNSGLGVTNEWSGNFLNWATMTRIDEVRSILYGGYRFTDTESATVLERSYLPNDAHSFAKYYNGTDVRGLAPFGNVGTGVDNSEDVGITICNTTYYNGSQRSQNVTAPPLARAVRGNYSLWAANERAQCLFNEEYSTGNANNKSLSGIQAHSNNPTNSDKAQQANGQTIGDYVVRVKVCEPGFVGFDNSSHDCQEYTAGNFKPTGLLQEFGEDDSAVWGLMSGSYTKNKSGGVLRKDIGTITNEINDNGTFKATPADGGIIKSLDSLRIANYSVSDSYIYNNADNCAWGLNYFNDGSCSNWGNPFSEIMQECYRYFANQNPNAQFNANDTTLFSDLKTDTSWNNPLSLDTACAKLNVIAFNASTISYDADQLASGVASKTDVVGNTEIESASQYFVGENGTNNDQLCTPKYIANLSSVRGTCPDAPRLSGSYNVAGLAYDAFTRDIRGDLPGEQHVTTWGVDLAPGVPKVTVDVPGGAGKQVSILPACRNQSINGNCGLVDFKIVSQSFDGTTSRGSFYVNWEDSEQGGDYDQDMYGVISYELTNSTLRVTSNVISESTTFRMGFGYILGGTTSDGFKVHSGIGGFNGGGCSNCNVWNNASTRQYSVGASSAQFLQPPLYYAAKWGGFDDRDNNGLPSVTMNASDNSEWDTDGDGKPDNYVLAINPVELKRSMRALITQIVERTASGTAAAVSAQTGNGEGAIYQASYTPRVKEAGSDYVTWAGSLRAFFRDRYGRIRQDSNTNGALDVDDREIKFIYDSSEQSTFIQAYVANADGTTGAPEGGRIDLTDTAAAKPIWDAQQQLSALTSLTSNRSYTSSADNGRYIFTSIDRSGTSTNTALDGQVISPGDVKPNAGQSASADQTFAFEADEFMLTGNTQNDFRYLGLDASASQTQVNDLVNFIRGDESISGMRNRSAGSKKYLLGDIIHSSPTVVSRPNDRYDIKYRDKTYEAFLNLYKNRRSVIYVGANDGMLHAFNGGFFNSATNKFDLKRTNETEHPLGAELWAYVPFNLLPHLKWLADEDYPHVYYVDGPVRSYDVNIFPADPNKYPGGWGTILVVSMRFGGGDYAFDHDGDVSTPNITTRSAYIIMDVTDPESPPELLAEITDVDLGFTLSEPTLVKRRKRGSSGAFSTSANNSWYLLFGSGPGGNTAAERKQALLEGVSFKSPHAYVFDLRNKELNKIAINDEAGIPEVNSFTGGFAAVDWDGDYQDDAAYYGLVSGTPAAPGGKLKRAKLDFNSASLVRSSSNFSTDLFNDASLPFSATPRTYQSADNEWWVYAGTGRFLVPDDNESTQQQYSFGIKEPQNVNGVKPLNQYVDLYYLLDTTTIDVYEDGRVREDLVGGVTLNAAGQSEPLGTNGRYEDVEAFVAEHASGWYFKFESAPTTLNNRIRNTTRSAISGRSLFMTAYEATGQVCDLIGRAYLYAPSLEAGIPAPYSPIGTDSNYKLSASDPNDPDPELVMQGTVIGNGTASDAVITPIEPPGDTRPGPCGNVNVQTGSGQVAKEDINCPGIIPGRQSWREIPVTW
ncbi:pilus assembly protein [Agaribacterium haliotis]|uniref:pilus assembly protein n=1 Tax=Agaribacterium haliotis TaxID=2013869 RepID=UPI0013046693|nr:PilC/PilY family type IV pilus protein [Agaribacterium haliotis]